MAKRGFYNYDDAVVGEDGVIYKEDLTALPSSGAVQTGSGSSFDAEEGFTCVVASGLKISGVSGQAALGVEGTVSLLMSSDAFDSTVAASGSNESFINFKSSNTMNIQKNNTSKYVKLICGTTLNGKFPGTIDQWFFAESDGRELVNGLVEVVMTWDQCGFKLWVDRFKAFDVLWTNSATLPDFTEIYLGAISSGGGTYTYKNLLVSDKKTVIKSASHVTRSVSFYGDSYAQQGNYPQVDASGHQSTYHYSSSDDTEATSYTEDGLNSDDGNFDNNGALGEAGMIPSCQRGLAKKGLFTNKVRFWAEGGTGYTDADAGGTNMDVEARVDVALNGNYSIPDVAVIVAGYNDATGAADTSARADIVTAAQGIVDALTTANANIKIIMTTLPYNTNTNYMTGVSDKLAKAQAVNAAITSVANANTEVKLIDMHTIFGGSTNDGSTNMEVDYVHPSRAGQAIYGNRIGNAINDFVRHGNKSTVSI